MILQNKKAITDFLLDEHGVDQISQTLQDWMAQSKVQPKNIVRARLVMENLLDDLCVRFDRNLHVSVEMGRRFGATRFVIRYQSESYNPIQKKETDAWTQQLLSHVGLMPTWSCKRGVNELVLRLPKNKLRSEIWLFLAFLAAVLLGISKPVLPAVAAAVLGDYLFPALSTIFMNLMGTFAGILVFLSVIAGICGVGNVADFSKMGRYLIGRNILLTFLGAGIGALLMLPFFSFRFGTAGGVSQLSALADMILQTIPENPVSPFLTGNMLQIVFMAVFIGVVMVLLGSRTEGVRSLVLQTNAVALRLIEIVCRLLPLYILSSLSLMFWENGMAIFRSIWKPLVLCVLFAAGLMAAKLLIVAVRCRTRPLKLFKKVLPGFLIGLTTASSSAAFGTVMEENEKDLGIDRQLSNFGFPIEMILSNSTVSAGFIAIMYFLAEYEGVEVNAMWFVSAWILITIMTFAMPPVSGGTLVCLTVLLSQLHISAACLGMAGTIALLGDFSMTASRIVISQMELVLESKHWNTLDEEKLRS